MKPKQPTFCVPLDEKRRTQLQQQLSNEIAKLERSLEQIKASRKNVDFSMIQSYKELIASREQMLKSIGLSVNRDYR